MVEIHWGRNWRQFPTWQATGPPSHHPRHKFLFLRCWPMYLFLSICMLQEIIQNAWIFCWGHKRDAKQVARLEFACSYITGLRHPSHFQNLRLYRKTLPKAQRTRGLSVLTKVTSLGHITRSWSNFIFWISTKHQPQNLKQILVSKYWPKFSVKICTELTLQNLNQSLFSKPEKN